MAIRSKEIKQVESLITEILSGMKLSLRPEVSADVSGIKVNLVGADTAIIIGYHGETLADFSYLVSIIVRKQLGNDVFVRIDVADYMKNKDKRIVDLALGAIGKVKKTGFPECLTSLNSYERRIVHSTVDKEGLDSESTGAGKDRTIVIKPTVGE